MTPDVKTPQRPGKAWGAERGEARNLKANSAKHGTPAEFLLEHAVAAVDEFHAQYFTRCAIRAAILDRR